METLTQGRDQAADDAAAARARGADPHSGFRGHAPQRGASLQRDSGVAHDDALMPLQVVRVITGLFGLVEDSTQLISFVAAFGEEAREVGLGKVSVAEVLEQFPYLRHAQSFLNLCRFT